MGIRYTLELSEEQAEIIKIALEEYFRLRMNQTWDFADSLCFEDLKKNHTKEEFNKCIENRNMFRDELERLLNKVHPLQFRGNKFREQTIEMRRAQDIWQVIRHRLWKNRHVDKDDWCVDARKPMPMTGDPLPKMESGEEFKATVTGSADIAIKNMVIMTAECDVKQRILNPVTKLHMHSCRDGSMGLANFLGFRKVED